MRTRGPYRVAWIINYITDSRIIIPDADDNLDIQDVTLDFTQDAERLVSDNLIP